MDDSLASLERLARLRDSGVLSEDEFEAEKAKILGGRGRYNAAGQPRRWLATRNGKIATVAALVILLSALAGWWWLSPYWTLRNMQSALAAKDADAFSRYVDFENLRSDLKADAIADLERDTQSSKGNIEDGFAAIGAAMIGPMIDGMISPQGIRTLFAMKNPADGDPGLMKAAAGGQVIRNGLTEFQVQAAKGDVFDFSLNGTRWQLSGIDVAPSRKKPKQSPAPTIDGTEFALPKTPNEPSASAVLTGTWTNVDEECGSARDILTFSGNGEYNTAWTDGSWSVEGDTLLLSQSTATTRVPFSISGDQLSLRYDDGAIAYQRCG